MEIVSHARAELETRMGYSFKDRALLDEALTHRSALTEGAARSNESLEFLGDAVLGFVIAEKLHRGDPTGDEGKKTRARARIVSAATLADVAAEIGLAPAIRLSAAEERHGTRRHASIWSDALEALIGAIYLDGGMDAARSVATMLFGKRLALLSGRDEKDAKGALQELLQAQGRSLPVYEVEAVDGPEHARVHRVRCIIDGIACGQGEGTSRKKAELAAAAEALKSFERG